MGSDKGGNAKEAMQYRKADGGAVDCFLCSHRCHIKAGHRGACMVRENRDGTLYSLVYGMAISSNPDPIEKKPLFHVLPGTRSYSIATVGCNFRCNYCQNWQISQAPAGGGDIMGRYISPEQIVEEAVAADCASVAYTYTEPTIFFEYAYDTARLAQARGLKNVFVTNGYQTPETVEKMAGVIDAANVDLKAFTDEFYRTRCKARLQPVLDSIRKMHEVGIFVEVTTLLLPGQNDSDEELRRIAEFLVGLSPDIPWHVSRFHPDFQALSLSATPPQTVLRAVEVGRSAGLRFVYAGNLPGTGYEDTVCPGCGHTVVERRGFSVGRIDLKDARCGRCGRELPFLTDPYPGS